MNISVEILDRFSPDKHIRGKNSRPIAYAISVGGNIDFCRCCCCLVPSSFFYTIFWAVLCVLCAWSMCETGRYAMNDTINGSARDPSVQAIQRCISYSNSKSSNHIAAAAALFFPFQFCFLRLVD